MATCTIRQAPRLSKLQRRTLAGAACAMLLVAAFPPFAQRGGAQIAHWPCWAVPCPVHLDWRLLGLQIAAVLCMASAAMSARGREQRMIARQGAAACLSTALVSILFPYSGWQVQQGPALFWLLPVHAATGYLLLWLRLNLIALGTLLAVTWRGLRPRPVTVRPIREMTR